MAKALTYTTQNEEVTIYGFIAFLLQQGEDWDYRCMEPTYATTMRRLYRGVGCKV